jgi:hypothetical protein
MYGYGKSAKTLHCAFKHQLQCMDASLHCAPFSMTGDVIPSQSEESRARMLHFAALRSAWWSRDPVSAKQNRPKRLFEIIALCVFLNIIFYIFINPRRSK